MRVKYFSDTDTAYLEFRDNDVYETKKISENIQIKNALRRELLRAEQYG